MNFPIIGIKQSHMHYWGGMGQYLGRLQPISPKTQRFPPKSKIPRLWSTVCSMRTGPNYQIRSNFHMPPQTKFSGQNLERHGNPKMYLKLLSNYQIRSNFHMPPQTKFSDQNLQRHGNPKMYLKLLSNWIIYLSKSRKKTQVKRGKKMIQASIKAVFQDFGCSAHASKAMVEGQGIDTLDDLCFLKDGNVETLCKNVQEVQLEVITGEPILDIWSANRLK